MDDSTTRLILVFLFCLLVQPNKASASGSAPPIIKKATPTTTTTLNTPSGNNAPTSQHQSTTLDRIQTTPNVTAAPLKKISIHSWYPIITHHTTTPPHRTGFEPKSSLSNLSPRKVKLFQQVAAVEPGLSDNINAGFGLSDSQFVSINNFMELLTNTRTNPPQNITDILKFIKSSGLFGTNGNASTSVSNVDTKIEAATDVCEKIKNSTATFNTTVAQILNSTQLMDMGLELFNTTLNMALDWCDERNKTIPHQTHPIGAHSNHHDQWKKCQMNIQTMVQGVGNMDTWALQLLDASAKPGSSLMKGNLKFMGNYKQCQDVSYRDSKTSSRIDGHICRAFIKLPDSLLPSVIVGQTPRLQWDLCLPKSCLDFDLNKALREQSLGSDIRMVCTKDFDLYTDGAAIVAVGILTLFGLLLMMGTAMDIFINNTSQKGNPNDHSDGQDTTNGYRASNNQGFDRNQEKHGVTSFTEQTRKSLLEELSIHGGESLHPRLKMTDLGGTGPFTQRPVYTIYRPETRIKINNSPAPLPRWQRALLAFSIPRNTEKILSVKSTSGSIGCLHGIRVLSIGWVVLGHVIMVRAKFENPMDLFDMVNTFAFQIIVNAPLAVDTFFLMSGLLTGYVFLKTLGKKGRISPKEFVMYYVHRYWRLTPSLLIWIMIVACLLQYIGEGRPAWTDYSMAQNCRNNWWTNVLYINNVYKHDKPCVGVTWYLAHDMQFYVVAPLALIPWVYGKKALGFLAATVFIGIHVASTIWLEVKYNVDMFTDMKKYSHEIYFKPYTRVAPFAIGLIVGWILWKTKSKVRMNKCLVFFGWISCLTLILTLTLVTYDENQDFDYRWPKSGRVVFETLSRPLWATAIAWMVFACVTGYGGYVNSILSWEGWLPLSRLTYSAFIVHLTIIRYEAGQPEYTFLFTLTSLSYNFIGYFVMAYAVGYLLTVSVESPMLGLEKVIFG